MDKLKDELEGLELDVFEIEDVTETDTALGYCYGGCISCESCICGTCAGGGGGMCSCCSGH